MYVCVCVLTVYAYMIVLACMHMCVDAGDGQLLRVGNRLAVRGSSARVARGLRLTTQSETRIKGSCLSKRARPCRSSHSGKLPICKFATLAFAAREDPPVQQNYTCASRQVFLPQALLVRVRSRVNACIFLCTCMHFFSHV